MNIASPAEEFEMANKRPTPIIRDADELLSRGIEAIEFDRIDEAVGLMRQAAELAPDSHDVQLVFGIALMRAIDLSGAIAAFETAIALDPKSFFAHFRMGEAYMRVGVPTSAKEYLSQAMQLSATKDQRQMVRHLLSLDAKRAPRRAWRPDFGRLLGKKKPQ
jgi:tetratricopeptide (TPR) repeat protein